MPAFAALFVGCGGGDCLIPPCPMPFGISLTITSASTAAPVNATVDVTGAVLTTLPCNGTCQIPGAAGTYQLKVSAPGFQTSTLNVTVTGKDIQCGCPSVDPQHLDIKLTPAA